MELLVTARQMSREPPTPTSTHREQAGASGAPYQRMGWRGNDAYEIMEAYTCLVSREVDGSGGAKVPASALCPVASAQGGALKGPHGSPWALGRWGGAWLGSPRRGSRAALVTCDRMRRGQWWGGSRWSRAVPRPPRAMPPCAVLASRPCLPAPYVPRAVPRAETHLAGRGARA